MAIGAAAGDADFYAQGTASSGAVVATVAELNRQYQPDVPITRLTVPIATLDGLAEKEGVIPTLVKVDVEGYETAVLKGASGLLGGNTSWLIEVHPPQLRLFGDNEDTVHTILVAAGYHVEVVYRNPNTLYTIVATRTGRS
jgi:hypothetical protein